ncbi:phosphoglycerate dehydrogenase [Feifania hominis]|uniref:Phosphoglycerate dehydrogenase n=1 Tax=Feifania hominis TaxID=2763660 RepID=A0A926DFF4_9FIRM|nr:phosphoglycerate dehydrogenase [Feifania hominis]MBC8536040.1 phosphoglycerate dehydrogenase [Feifania hominis]
MKILVTPRSFARGDDRPLALLHEAGCEVVRNPFGAIMTKEQMCQAIRDCDGVIIGVDPLDREVIEAAPKLKAIAKYGVGVDNIDLDYAEARAIRVSVTRGANSNSVADYTFSLLLAAARGVPMADARCRRHRWERVQGVDVFQKTIGILGLGAIGRGVAARARGFDMRVLAYDLYWDEEYAQKQGITYAPPERIYAEADFITLHLPLTPETEHMVDAAAFESMKPTAVLVNTARGGLVDEAALVAALQSGRIFAAGVDVFCEEPPANPALYELENLVMSAHCAAASPSAAAQMSLFAAQNLLRDLNVRNLVHS